MVKGTLKSGNYFTFFWKDLSLILCT